MDVQIECTCRTNTAGQAGCLLHGAQLSAPSVAFVSDGLLAAANARIAALTAENEQLKERLDYFRIPCDKCGGSGFKPTAQGTGYDDVCDCAGGYIGYLSHEDFSALTAENERLRGALVPLLATTQEYQIAKAQLEEVLSRRPTVKGTADADGSERFEEWRREYAPLHDKVYRTLLWKIADAAEDLRAAIDAAHGRQEQN